MAHAGLQHCLPCPSKATALLHCNCHLALPCPHCTATPVSLRLTALPGMHTPAAPRMHCVLRVPHFFALPVPAVPYGFVRNRPFTVRMSCMLCAASACRRRGACGASVHRRRLCACANCNHPACTAEHCTLPPRVTQAPARPSHDESSVHCRCQAGQTRMPKPLHTTACMLASCPCSCTALHCTVQAGQR